MKIGKRLRKRVCRWLARPLRKCSFLTFAFIATVHVTTLFFGLDCFIAHCNTLVLRKASENVKS